MTKLSPRVRTRVALVAGLVATALAAGCGKSVTALSSDGSAGSGGSHGGAGTTGTGGGGGHGQGTSGTNGSNDGGYDGPTLGQEAGAIPFGMTQCSDGKDNDGDGKIDSADPECTGPADNDEGTFATGIPGDNIDACKQDCFFDGNSGMGDDGCLWELQCDPKNTNTKCPYDPTYVQKHQMACSISDSQSQKCIDNCRKYVPNGCDCFGCCAIPGAPTPIRLDPTCTAKDFGDPTKCSPCTQVTACMNPCEKCELCVGKDTVPEDCTTYTPPPPNDAGVYDGGTDVPPPPPPKPDGGGYAMCSGGYQTCVPGPNPMCPAGTGCVTGCCLPVIP